MQVHGTEDPCWTYEESSRACLDDSGELKVGVEDSTNAWVERLACDPESAEAPVLDAVDDGTATTQIRWTGCDGEADVILLRIDGGGHAWPGGHQYFAETTIGIAPQDWDVGLIWDFFAGAVR
jgi:polyhydroxybutyrate depolymerase